jgi:hypothetical protein
MEMKLGKIRHLLITYKVYLSRANGYAGIISLGMLLYLSISDLKKYGILIKLDTYFFPILLFVIAFLIFLGWVDDKIGLFREEIRFITRRNPQMEEVLEQLKSIKEDLKNLK